MKLTQKARKLLARHRKHLAAGLPATDPRRVKVEAALRAAMGREETPAGLDDSWFAAYLKEAAP